MSFLRFFKMIGKSKRLLRTGWVREKIHDPESVAEHSFRAGVMAMVMADQLEKNINKEKLIKMALLHDLGEVITGDLVYERADKIELKKRRTKERYEKEGIHKIFSIIGQEEEYETIFQEMIERKTIEAKIFWQFDKLEMAIQALEYEEEQGKNLEEFFMTTSLYIKNPVLKGLFDEIMEIRRKNKKHSIRAPFARKR